MTHNSHCSPSPHPSMTQVPHTLLKHTRSHSTTCFKPLLFLETIWTHLLLIVAVLCYLTFTWNSYLGTNLVTALSGLKVYNFPHCAGFDNRWSCAGLRRFLLCRSIRAMRTSQRYVDRLINTAGWTDSDSPSANEKRRLWCSDAAASGVLPSLLLTSSRVQAGESAFIWKRDDVRLSHFCRGIAYYYYL